MTLSSLPALAVIQNSQWNKTRAIKGLPFPAFILREYLGEFQPGLEVHILMDPDDVTEDNLRLLFELVSEKYTKAKRLVAMVSTDIEQLESLITGYIITGSPPQEKADVNEETTSKVQKRSRKRIHKWAYYRRTKEVELFRYNPDYPNDGMKTIILKGKE
jgi:hypothetical protein